MDFKDKFMVVYACLAVIYWNYSVCVFIFGSLSFELLFQRLALAFFLSVAVAFLVYPE